LSFARLSELRQDFYKLDQHLQGEIMSKNEPSVGNLSLESSMTTTTNSVSFGFFSDLKELYKYRDLVWAWGMRTIRARYKQSILGGLWAILQPVIAAIIFSVIFTFFVPVDTGDTPYIVFSYTAMVPWILFTSSTADMVDSLVANMGLVSKIYFPREVLPISALMARLLDFAIAMALLLILILVFQVPIFPLGLLFLPVILLVQIAFSLGLGLFGSALNVFYRDIRSLVGLILQIWLYVTPIIYPVTMVPERLQPFYFLNPMAGIIEAYRSVLLYQQLPGPYFALSSIVAIVTLFFGYWFFKRLEFQFADVV
jgi:lipopolysaccharide transport system permease protein